MVQMVRTVVMHKVMRPGTTSGRTKNEHHEITTNIICRENGRENKDEQLFNTRLEASVTRPSAESSRLMDCDNEDKID